jgi:hypothetical protein
MAEGLLFHHVLALPQVLEPSPGFERDEGAIMTVFQRSLCASDSGWLRHPKDPQKVCHRRSQWLRKGFYYARSWQSGWRQSDSGLIRLWIQL